MTELQQEGVLSTLTPEQTDKLFHSPAMRRLFQKNASDEYALIWLLSKHMKDRGSEKIYLKDMVREMNLPLPKVTAIARSLQNKGLVTWNPRRQRGRGDLHHAHRAGRQLRPDPPPGAAQLPPAGGQCVRGGALFASHRRDRPAGRNLEAGGRKGGRYAP